MQRLLVTLACFALASCSSTTDNGTTDVDMLGTWSYSATQSTPALAISGMLTVDQQAGASFSGSAQFTETDLQGAVRTRTGQLNGRVIGNDAVDFDVFVDATSRRHVGAVFADSIKGTWAVTGTGSSVTGSFTARRLP